MSRKHFRLIEHTADIGIKVTGKDLKELFSRAAEALFDLGAQRLLRVRLPEKKKFLVRLKAANVEELFVNWLNELLSLSAVKLAVFCDFKFRKLTEACLEAVVWGCDNSGYTMRAEIKAATYHELSVKKTKAGWSAKVIFDV